MSDYIRPMAAVLLPQVGGIVRRHVTKNNIPTWFEHLRFPSWRPPNRVFGPIWATMYTGMGAASYLVWRDGGGFGGDAALPLALYGTQLALNWAWAPLFFGAHKIGWAFVEICCLWGTVAATTVAFYPVSKTASCLMVPYLAWVTFTSTLNFAIWKLNKDRRD